MSSQAVQIFSVTVVEYTCPDGSQAIPRPDSIPAQTPAPVPMPVKITNKQPSLPSGIVMMQCIGYKQEFASDIVKRKLENAGENGPVLWICATCDGVTEDEGGRVV